MKNPLIGVVLKGLLDSYNTGACDNMSSEELEKLLEQVTLIADNLADKLDKVLTIEETSQYLRVSRLTVATYVKEGKLKPRKHLGGVMEFKLRDLKRFVLEYKKS